MQLSNEPAEELAKLLTSSSNGAFDLCGFVSGGTNVPLHVASGVTDHPYHVSQDPRLWKASSSLLDR